jgi:UDP-2,3-diacylglucosamine pyrophosphatase LpxH
VTAGLQVISDLHLPFRSASGLAADFAAVVRAHPDRELVLAGDSFDLSAAPRGAAGTAGLSPLLRLHPPVVAALRQRLQLGASIVLVPGNHDAQLLAPETRGRLLEVLDLTAAAPLEIAPWFVRRSGLHIEHGHLYDPDNAPSHPLVLWKEATEPLGIALTRRFLTPRSAYSWVHRHETTPLKGMFSAFGQFGLRAPGFIGGYYYIALGLCRDALRGQEHHRERQLGNHQLSAFGAERGLSTEVLEQLLQSAPVPTHHHPLRTLRRLYLDRSASTAVALTGGLGLAFGLTGAGGTLLTGAGLLALSLLGGVNRYGGRVEQRLREAAQLIGQLTQAQLVVFGHSHAQDDAPGYVNCGSFGKATDGRRSSLLVEADGSWTRWQVPPA